MEVTIHVSPDDLMNVRFAYSPLVEVVTSYYVLINPHLHAPYLCWVNEAQHALHDVDLPYMHALIACKKSYIPDFLTPTPTSTHRTFEEDIQILLQTPDSIIRNNIEMLIADKGESDINQLFLVYPREMMLCLVDELRLYWQRVLAHHWSTVTSILDGDILYRGRRLALNGASGLFGHLHDSISYQPGQIKINKNKPHDDIDVTLQGEGIQLVPAAFTGQGIWWQVVPEWQPMIIYSARGMGLWRQKASEPDQSLEIALGAGRARLLQALTTPSNTGELARLLQVSAGAISQHLSRLQQAGLVEPHRSGKRVYYHLTSRGANLLAVFDQTS